MRYSSKAPRNLATQILYLLLEHGPMGLSPLQALLPNSNREGIRKSLQRHRERGQVELVQGKWTITPTGMAQLSEAARAISGSLLEHPGWSEIISALPIPEHRAVFRLGAAIAIAKSVNKGELGLIPWIGLAGRPGSGKSLTGRLLLEVLGGLEISAATSPTGEILGRRTSTTTGVVFEPSPILAGPIALIDELDKAPTGTIGAYFQLLEGRSTIKAEGQEFPHQAAVIATWNPSRGDLSGLPEGVARRSIILDTTRFTTRLRREFQINNRATFAWEVLKRYPGPWIDLAELRAKDTPKILSDPLKKAQGLLFDLATAEGQEAGDTGIIYSLSMGYELMGYSPLVAIAEAVSDLCMVRATRPELIKPEWAQRIAEFRAKAVSFEDSPIELSTQADPDNELVSKTQTIAEAIQFETARSAKIAELDYLREHLGRAPGGQTLDQRIQREGFLGALRQAKRMLEKAESAADLQVVADPIEAAISQVRIWIAEAIDRKEAEMRILESQRRALQNQKTQERQRLEQIKQLRAMAKILSKASKGALAKPDSAAFKLYQATIQDLYQKGWLKKVRLEPTQIWGHKLWDNWGTLDATVQPHVRVFSLHSWMEQKAQKLERKALHLERAVKPSLITEFGSDLHEWSR